MPNQVVNQNKSPDSRDREILDCAALVFAEHGYRHTDVQEIANRLGVGKGTVYRRFATKETLFLAAVDWGMQQLDRRVKEVYEAGKDDPYQAIKAVFHEYLSFFDQNPEFVELFSLERAEFKDRKKPTYAIYKEANAADWIAATEQLMDKGCFRKLPVEDVMEVANNLLYGTIFTGVFSGQRRPMAEKADVMLDVLMNGLLSEPRKQ
ncbi:MAG: TetR/AcrR family transcriptional regulator [Lentisphaeria bacterium]